MEYDRGDGFPFDYKQNGFLFGSKSKRKLSSQFSYYYFPLFRIFAIVFLFLFSSSSYFRKNFPLLIFLLFIFSQQFSSSLYFRNNFPLLRIFATIFFLCYPTRIREGNALCEQWCHKLIFWSIGTTIDVWSGAISPGSQYRMKGLRKEPLLTPFFRGFVM